jgi:hypothetical protein
VLVKRHLEGVDTCSVFEYSPLIASGRGLKPTQVHWRSTGGGGEVSVDIVVELDHEGRCVEVKDMAGDQGVLAAASIGAGVAMAPGLLVAVWVLDDIHLTSHLHSAYCLVGGIHLAVAVEGAAVACHRASHLASPAALHS